MGRRTLVVTVRGDGRLDCRIAHWGVDADPLAQSRPLGCGWTPEEVLDKLDAAFELLLVVDGTVRTYCVCWLDPTLTDDSDVALALTDDPESLRTRWVTVKSHASRTVSRDSVDARTARAALLLALRRWADRVHTDDASFLRDDR